MTSLADMLDVQSKERVEPRITRRLNSRVDVSTIGCERVDWGVGGDLHREWA